MIKELYNDIILEVDKFIFDSTHRPTFDSIKESTAFYHNVVDVYFLLKSELESIKTDLVDKQMDNLVYALSEKSTELDIAFESYADEIIVLNYLKQ